MSSLQAIPQWLVVLTCLFWLFAIRICWGLWRRDGTITLKFFSTLIAFVPVIGVFLVHLFNPPPPMPPEMRATMSHRGGGKFWGGANTGPHFAENDNDRPVPPLNSTGRSSLWSALASDQHNMIPRKKIWYGIALFVVAPLFGGLHWLQFFIARSNGDELIHIGYWDAPVGTNTLLALLLTVTFIWLLVIWRMFIRPNLTGKNQKEISPEE